LERDSFHLVQRAWAAYQAKHYEVAEREAQAALAIEPNEPEALSVLSLCAMQRKDRATAVKLAEEAICHAADYAVLHYRLAMIHSRFGDHKATEPHLKTTLALDPTFGAAYAIYAWVYWRRGHTKIALAAVEEALKFDPRDWYALNLRIELLQVMGDRKRAQEAVAQALEIDPENKRTHTLAGALNLQLDRDTGLTHLREAVRLDPTDEGVRRTYAEALEGATRTSRILHGVLREFKEGSTEFWTIGGMTWTTYLLTRQKDGPLGGDAWTWLSYAIAIPVHVFLLIVWWGPLLLVALVRDRESLVVINSEFPFGDRTRLTRPWHISLSLAVLLSLEPRDKTGIGWERLSWSR
jgi:tetratricopeptide (TPR) repeat protein